MVKPKTPKNADLAKGQKRKAQPSDNEASTPRKQKKTKPNKPSTSKYDSMDDDDDDDDFEVEDDYRDEDFVIDPEFVENVAETTIEHSPSPAGSENEVDADDYTDEEKSATKKVSKRKSRSKAGPKRGMSPLLQLLDNQDDIETTSTVNFSNDKDTAYLAYDDNLWTPEYMYRLPSDITLGCIRKSSGEGIGRVEVGQSLMMDTSTKAGNRRVSAFILNVCNDKKEYVGQFQKMDGKIRCIKYFWKADSQPERFSKLFEDFERITGKPCPFKMGQVIKFPTTNLSTLRMSDVSLRRIIDLLEILQRHRVIVTIHRVLKIVEDKERASGYKFSIDKKSLMKCMKALEAQKLLNLFETDVVAENVSNKVQVMCHPEITNVDDPLVWQCIQDTIDVYHKEGRVFPHGQLRYSVKKHGELHPASEPDPFITDEIIEPSKGVDLLDRFRIYRKLTSRASVASKSCKAESQPELEDSLSTMDELDTEPESSPRKDVSAVDPSEEWKNVTLMNGEHTENIGTLMPPLTPLQGDDERKRGIKLNSEMALECGYQAKSIRLYVLHEIVFQLVHGYDLGAAPNFYDKFDTNIDPAKWPEREIHELPVYVDDDSPFRFLPHLPPFQDKQRGWFIVQDLVTALPLSVFVLCAYVGKTVPRDILHEYLGDPTRRHICIGDLPMALRLAILRDKKVYRQIEHLLFTLCALGLFVVGENPDKKRFISAPTTLFFVHKCGVLYDTSTSNRGYANVTLPLNRYDRYDYEFNSVDDISVFWHHLRAIVQSTPLSFRNDLNSNEVSLNRHKKYSPGQFDRVKGFVTRSVNEEIDVVLPLEPMDGVAGFDSALFLHLRRHWDLNPRPSHVVSWYVTRFRKLSDSVRTIVESRVEKLQQDWNSYVKSLMPSDLDLFKSKRKSNGTALYPSTRASIAIEPKSKTRLQQNKKAYMWRKKKRPLDSVDLVSAQSRINVRSRFNSRERDMLILIRAIGFFLNPVYRFWLDPAVLRDIMHEYVPESRSKTVQSLMAAGVREMVRPARLAYLQRIVRNLSTFQEMRDLRFQLASAPLSTPESKTTFFKNAFDIANRLLFMENQSMPHITASNKMFEDFLKAGQVVISAEQAFTNPIPLRSQMPTSLGHIHHCVAVNLLLSILLHSTEGSFSEKILDQVSATVIHQALQVLRTDGLVSRTRSMDPQLQVITKNQAVLSYYFRHFFAHRFHPDIMEDTYAVQCRADEAHWNETDRLLDLNGDHIGMVVRAAATYYTQNDIELEVPEDVLGVFMQVTTEQILHSIKQIRYLENVDLRIDDIKILENCEAVPPKVTELDHLLKMMDRSQTDEKPIPFEAFIKTMDSGSRSTIRAIHDAIDKTGAYGASMADLLKKLNGLSKAEIRPLVQKMFEGRQIVEAGVDVCRYVAAAYSAAWCVCVDGKRIYPRPWTIPTGGICPATIRWMGESCLLAVVTSPGIPSRDLHFRFEFALQPAALDDLIAMLEMAGCLTVCEEVFESIELSSPFDETVPQTVYTYLLPTVDCLEKFSRIFASIPLLPSMTSMGNKNDDSEDVSTAVVAPPRRAVSPLDLPGFTLPRLERRM